MSKKIFKSLFDTCFILLFIFFIHGGFTLENLKFYLLGVIICTPIMFLLNNYILRYILKDIFKWKENKDKTDNK